MRKHLFEGMINPPLTEAPPPADGAAAAELARALDRVARRRLGRSLSIRQVDAGSCNGCESELQALNNPFYNLHRLGVFFTASPRFADLLLVTGPVTYAMRGPLLEAYEAMPDPKFVMAMGTCAVSGGTNGGGYAEAMARPGSGIVDVITPPSSVAALRAGYEPQIDPARRRGRSA